MYLTLKHLVDRYGAEEIVAVTNDRTSAQVNPDDLREYVDGNEASPNTDILLIERVVNERIEDAIAYAMSFVHTVYDVAEFTEENVPRDLRAVTAQVARYYLHENRMTQRVHQGFQDAQFWLDSKPNIGVNEAGSLTKQSGVTIQTNVKHKGSRVFSDDSESRFTEGY